MPLVAHVVSAAQTILAFAAPKIGVDDDMISNLKFNYAFPNRGNFPRPVRAVDVGQFQFQSCPTVADHHIHAVQRRCPQSDKYFASFGFWIGEIRIF